MDLGEQFNLRIVPETEQADIHDVPCHALAHVRHNSALGVRLVRETEAVAPPTSRCKDTLWAAMPGSVLNQINLYLVVEGRYAGERLVVREAEIHTELIRDFEALAHCHS